MWNSVHSTEGAKYMCLDIKNFYLTAPLDRFEYMKMPIALFLAWIVKQYNLTQYVLNGFIYLEMQRAVWGLPQAGILANNCCAIVYCLTGITNAPTHRVYGNTRRGRYLSC
jgi:hypothetical protein